MYFLYLPVNNKKDLFSFSVQTWQIEVREKRNRDYRASNRSRKYDDIGFRKRNDKEGFGD